MQKHPASRSKVKTQNLHNQNTKHHTHANQHLSASPKDAANLSLPQQINLSMNNTPTEERPVKRADLPSYLGGASSARAEKTNRRSGRKQPLISAADDGYLDATDRAVKRFCQTFHH